MSCAAKFEKNIREIETVEDIQLNFGASKLTVMGDASVEQLEKAGEFDGIKVYPEKQRIIEEKEPFWKKRENKTTIASLFLLILGFITSSVMGEGNTSSILLFSTAILVGGYDLFKVGLRNLTKLEFDMNTLMT